MKTKEETLKDLAAFIADECKAIDTEAAFIECLDESGDVNVAGLTFSPSRIWREMDPTAFRCGVNDYADGMEWTEIGGEYYDQREAEKARDSFVYDLECFADGLEAEIADLESDQNEHDPDPANEPEIGNLRAKLETLRENIEAAKSVELYTL